jgi:uncharacterized protein (DUF1015 family)
MPQIAGFRGVVPVATKAAEVIDAPGVAFTERLASGAIARDPGRALYRYHQLFQLEGRQVTRKAVVCAVRLVPWAERQIRAHEVADPVQRELELARIKQTGAHVEPVLAGFRDAAGEIDRTFRKVEGDRPTYEHATADGTIHRVWRSPSAEIMGPLRKVFAPKKLHVLEGHARYEAMLAYEAELAAKQAPSLYSTASHGLACLVNLDDVAVHATSAARHRIVRGAGVKAATVLAAARPWFIIETLAKAAGDVGKQRAALDTSVAHQPAFVLVFAGDPDAYKLTLSPDVSPANEGISVHRGIQKLDPVAIDLMFRPRALPDTTVTFETDHAAVLAAVGKGAPAAIITRPVPLDQVIHADELGALLPMGSTGFYPRIAPGIAMLIDPSEDLA